MSMYMITGGAGFAITLSNGYTVSAQFGSGNHCDNYSADPSSIVQWSNPTGIQRSTTAEISVLDPKGRTIHTPWDSRNPKKRTGALGYCSTDTLAEVIDWAAHIAPKKRE